MMIPRAMTEGEIKALLLHNELQTGLLERIVELLEAKEKTAPAPIVNNSSLKITPPQQRKK